MEEGRVVMRVRLARPWSMNYLDARSIWRSVNLPAGEYELINIAKQVGSADPWLATPLKLPGRDDVVMAGMRKALWDHWANPDKFQGPDLIEVLALEEGVT